MLTLCKVVQFERAEGRNTGLSSEGFEPVSVKHGIVIVDISTFLTEQIQLSDLRCNQQFGLPTSVC